MIEIALYQPDIPQNVGAAIRLCACLGVKLHVIEPCGFPWDPRKIKQSAMDYMEGFEVLRHASWESFRAATKGQRSILMSTKAADPYINFEFQDGDILLAGQESAGVPEEVHNGAEARVFIPMAAGARSLNVINATSMIASEALRQTKGFCL